MKVTRWLAVALAVVLVFPQTAVWSDAAPSPWHGGFPGAVVALWGGHDLLSMWKVAARSNATIPGTSVGTASPGVPARQIGVGTKDVGARIRAWVSAPGVVDLVVDEPPQPKVTAVTVELPLAVGEHIVGLGERFASLDLRGKVWDNKAADDPAISVKAESYSPAPFLLSSAGYGLAVDTDYPAQFDIGASRSDSLKVTITDPRPRLRLLTGAEPGDIIAGQAATVGLPPLPPQWALGVWKTLIGGTIRVKADADRLTAAGVPIDVVWIYDALDDRSGFGWRWPIYDPIPPGGYPDITSLIDAFHHDGTKVLGYLTPFVYRGSPAFTTAVTHRYLIADAYGQPLLENWGGTTRGQVDFTNPAAAAWFTKRVATGLSVVGFDGAMQDYGEGAPISGSYANGRPGPAEHNAYPLRYAQAVSAAVAVTKPGQAVFLARSGGSGTQHYATARFTGDQLRSWDPNRGLPSALHAMLSGGISGWPYWGPDIAGFEQADTRSNERELWTRWVELGAMSPIMRDMLGAAHQATDALTDSRTIATFGAYARLHSALEPYLHRAAQHAHDTGMPIARPLFLGSPGDPVAWTVDDEYQLGDDLIVAPILRPGQVNRRLYLPAGVWRDYWTGIRYTGPGWIGVPAPVDHVPLLVRNDSSPGLPNPATLWQTRSPLPISTASLSAAANRR